MSRWLVTGADGLLGANALRLLGPDARAQTRLGTRPGEIAADLSDPAQRAGVIERAEADVVLHCAALASIEACEQDPALAHEVNVAAAADLAAQAARHGAAFVQVSTDAVFDGRSGGYREDDLPSPTSEYGRSKLAAEREVLAVHPEALVARVNFFGWSPSGSRSLAEFFHTRLVEGREAPGFGDVTVSTLHVALLVDVLAELVARRVSGVAHVVSAEPTTKLDFGRRLARTLGLDADLVVPALSSDHLPTARGTRLDLDTSRTAAMIGRALPGQQEGLDLLRDEALTGVREQLRLR